MKKFVRYSLWVGIFMLTGVCLHAQDVPFESGKKAFQSKDYFMASGYFQEAIAEGMDNAECWYFLAESYRHFYAYDLAESAYSEVLTKAATAYPLAYYYRAFCRKSQAKYTEARKDFETYLSLEDPKLQLLSKRAQHEIDVLSILPKMLKDTAEVLIEHPEEPLNSPYSEFSPVSLNDTALAFSTLRPLAEASEELSLPGVYLSFIMSSRLGQGGWQKEQNWQSAINKLGTHNVHPTFNVEYDWMIFSRCEDNNGKPGRCILMESNKRKEKWEKPRKVSLLNTKEYTQYQPFLSVDTAGKKGVLFFVSDRPGGYGGMDIWYALYQNGKFYEPANLGPSVNTAGDELTPFYDIRDSVLFFSSDYLPGFGGFDIFKTAGFLNSWEKPENLGVPLNTSWHDLYFSRNRFDKDGYFVSNRPGSLFLKSQTCCFDIFYFESLQELKEVDSIVEIQEVDSIVSYVRELLPLTLYFHNDEPDPRSRNTSTKRNYRETLSDYFLLKDTYRKEYSKGLKGAAREQAIRDIEDFFDNYVAAGFADLQEFARLLLFDLRRGNDVRIKVKGYCSPLTSTEYNLNLAKRRISSLKVFLRKYGGGIFIPFMDGTAANKAKLIIYEDPIGELDSNPFVSDNPNDHRNSIYSRTAAFERKIQIVMYSSGMLAEAEADELPELTVNNDTIDFGVLKRGQGASLSLKITNSGHSEMIINAIESASSSLKTTLSAKTVLVGETVELIIKLNTDLLSAEMLETITIMSNAVNTKKIVFVKAFVSD